jgi:predicted CXXCH cytochrome family protein
MYFIKYPIFLAMLLFTGSMANANSRFFLMQDTVSKKDTSVYVSPFEADNNKCLQCHGQQKYKYTNETLGKEVTGLMCENRIIRRGEFYKSNHKSFSCTDCHSAEYVTFPHPGQLRMEEKFNCLDCHGGDETYARYHFEDIDTAYRKSVHFQLEAEGFTCWSCHDPHTYKLTARNRDNLTATIAYDNAICLNCHSDFNKYQLLTEKQEINLLQKHEWLPNQALHFSSVRCIECHTRVNDTLLIAHQILPKEKAVRHCNECHSQNSLLMASLYKYESKAQRSDGFFNGVILNQSYVIGANRNKYLNILSVVFLLAVLGIIGVHILFRIKNRNKNLTE